MRRLRTRRAWPVVLLLLFCALFWVSADLFHSEGEAGEDSATCPICHLARIAGSGAPVVAAVPPVPSFVAIGTPPEVPVSPAPSALVVGLWSPRGPPLSS